MCIERYAFEILFLQVSGTIRHMNLIDVLFNVKARLIFLFYGLSFHIFRFYKTRMATLMRMYN